MTVTATSSPDSALLYRIPPMPLIIAGLARIARTGVLHRVIYTLANIFGWGALVVLFALYIWVLPDGGSTAAITSFYSEHNLLIKVAMMLGPIVILQLLVVSGTVAARLYRVDTSPGHRVSWIGFASDLALIIYFAFEIGIMAATNLLVGKVNGEIIHALHVVTFTSAYMLGGVWLPFFFSFVLISRRTGIFPKWLELFAIVTAIANGLAWFAALSLTGPHNGQNGLISLGGPTFTVPFVLVLSAYLLLEELPSAVIRIDAQLSGDRVQV